jgi:hypothetical protein
MALLEKNLNFIWYGDSCDTDCEEFPFYSGSVLVEGFQNVISVAQIKPAGYVFSYWSRETDTENRESYENLPDLIKNNLGLSKYVMDSQGFVKFECGKSYVVKLDEGTQLEIPGAVVINLGSDSTRGLQALPCPTCPDATECGCEKIDLTFLQLDLSGKVFTGWSEQLSACMDFSQGTNTELFMSTSSMLLGTKLYLEERQYQDDGFSVASQWVVPTGWEPTTLFRIDGRTVVEIVSCLDIIPTPTPTPEFAVPSSTICISESTFGKYDGEYLYTGTRHNNRPVWGPNQDGVYFYYETPAGMSEFRWMLSIAVGSKLGQIAESGEITAYPYDVSWDGDDNYTHVIGTEECPTPTPTPVPPPFVPEVFYVDVCTTLGDAGPSFILGDAVAVNGKPVYFDFRVPRGDEQWDINRYTTHSPIVLGESSRIETSGAFDAIGIEVSMQYETDTNEFYLAFNDQIAYYYDQDASVYGIGTDMSNYTQTISQERTPVVTINKTTQQGDIMMSNLTSDSIAFFESDSEGVYTESEEFHLGDNVNRNAILGDTAVHSLGYQKQNSWGWSTEQLVVVYKKVNGTWQESQRLHPPEEHRELPYSSDTYFGQDVDITSSGDILITTINGAPGTNPDGGNRTGIGALYVFRPDQNGVYQYVQYIQPDNLNNMAYFGSSVSASGNYVAVGSRWYETTSPGYSEPISRGTVFIYEYDTTSSTYVLKARVEGDDPIVGQHPKNNFGQLGASVAINGDWLVAGAPSTLNQTDQNLPRPPDANQDAYLINPGATGAAYVYKRSGTAWNRYQKLNLENITGNQNFGTRVDISDDYLVVTACENRYVYTLVDDSWQLYSASNSFESGSCLAQGNVSTHGEILVQGTDKGAVVTDLSWYPSACDGFDSTMSIPGFENWPLLCGTGEFMQPISQSDHMCFEIEPPTPTPTPTPTPIPVDCSDTRYCVSGITGVYAEYNGTYVPGGKDLDGMDYWTQDEDMYGTNILSARFIREKSQEFGHGDDVHYQHNYVFTSRLPTTKLDYFIAITNPPMTKPRACPHEFEWDSFGISPGYFDNMTIVTDNCPPPMATEFVFRKIDFVGKQYGGWDDASLYTACVDAAEGLTVDTLTLYRTYDTPLVIGTELFMSTQNRFHEDFDVKGEWVYTAGTLFKLNGRVIEDVIDCDAVSEPTPTPQEPPWCGEPPEKDTYICVQGSGETAGKFDRPIDGRYYYSLQSPSDKTEWQSRNSLIYLVFLDKNDARNELGIDIWAFYADSGDKKGILYYTTEFDQESYCPPFETITWIPTGQMSSKFVTIYGFNNCGDSGVDRIPCDVLDASHEGWFDIPACKNTLNVEQTNAQATNTDCNINYKKYGDEFSVVINRGSGSPDVSEVFMQSEHGSFGLNPNATTSPGVGWYDYPGELPNACGSYEHIIEIPFTKVIDLVSLKTLTSTDRKFRFDVQTFSTEKQKWMRLGNTVIHESNQKISMNGKSLGGDSPSSLVKVFKNENYNVSEPPIDGSDVISESISGIRLYVGTWDASTLRGSKWKTNDAKLGFVNPLGEGGYSLVLHSIRVEGRDAADCFPDNVTQLTSAKIQGPTSAAPRKQVAPTLYPASVVILGEKCIGTRLHGNYRYDGDVQDILYEWKVNGTSKSTYRYLDTDDLSHGDVIEFSVTFKYLETKSTTYSTNATIERCKTLLLPANDTSGSFIYLKRENNSDGIPVYEGWPEYEVCDNYNAPWQVQMWWRGSLRQGSKLSLEKAYQTHEGIHGTNRWFYHKESRTVVELNTDKIVVSTFQCPPSDVTFSGTSVDEASGYGVQIGGLMSSPYNSNVVYSLVSGDGATHNNKFVLTGKNTQLNLHNFNLVRSSSGISYASTKSLQFRIRARIVDSPKYIERRFSVDVNPKPPEYFSCHNIKISGFTQSHILNGVYGLEAKTTSYGKFIGYEEVYGKYTYRNKGSNGQYARLIWSALRNRWELWIKSQPNLVFSPGASANDMQYLINHHNIMPGTTNPAGIFGKNISAYPATHSPTGHGHKTCPFPFEGVKFYCTTCSYADTATALSDVGIVTDAGRFEIGKDWQDT